MDILFGIQFYLLCKILLLFVIITRFEAALRSETETRCDDDGLTSLVRYEVTAHITRQTVEMLAPR